MSSNDIVIYNFPDAIDPVTPAKDRKYYADFEKISILEYVIEEIENGGSAIKGAAECECEVRNIYNWLPQFPYLNERFLEARQKELAHAYDKIVDIERRMLLPAKTYNDNTGKMESNPDWLHGEQARSILNSIFWRLERLQREKYGKEVKHTHGVEDYAAKLLAAKDRVESHFKGMTVNHEA